MHAVRRACLLAGAYLAASASSPAWAQGAEAELPPVVVTTPSPVVQVRSAPKQARQLAAKKKAAPKQTTAPATSPADEPLEAEAAPSAAPSDFAPLPGTLIVAADSFAPVTIATESEILAEQGATIRDALQEKPGISGSTFAPGANRPIIRGLDNYRVRIQENGISSHDVSALSEDHPVPIDPFAADRIEVVRGPATLRYGTQAIGGVVSVENQRVPTAIPEGGVSAAVKGGYSSIDEGGDGAFKVTVGANGIVVHADGFKRDAQDYDTPQGRQPNTFLKSEGGAAGASLVWDTGFLGVSYASIDSLYGIPGEEAFEARPRIDMNQEKVLARGEWRPGAFGVEAVRFWFGASDYLHEEVVFDDVEGADAVGQRFKNNAQEARAEIQHLPVGTMFGELRGAVGVQYGNRRQRAQALEEADSLLEPAETESLASVLFEELQVTPQLRLQAAGRIEENEVAGVARLDPLDPADPLVALGRTYHPVSGSLGALYELPLGVVARLTGQYVERAPDAAELFSKGIHEATGTFEIGDPNLGEEKARTVELGFKRAAGDLRFDTSLYYTRYDGFIFKRLTGVGCGDFIADCGVETELDQVLFSQRDATFHGLELAAQYDVAPIWRGLWGIDGQYDFVRAKFDGGENVPRIPPHRLGGGLYYRDANLFLRAGVLHAFRQDDIAPEEIETPGYTLVEAEASYTWALDRAGGLGPSMTLGVKGENLADDEVLNHASFKRREEVLLPGASVRVFGTMKLN